VTGSDGTPVGTRPPDLSIVLGTLNERAALPELIERINHVDLPPYELVVVDDGSSDGTQEYVRELSAADPRIRLLTHSKPRTLIPAQSEGIVASRGQFVVVMDSDLQHPPEMIPTIYQHLRAGADLVIASRYGAQSSVDRTAMRSMISRGAELIVRVVIREARTVSDPMSGFYAFRRTLFHPPSPMHRGYHMLPYMLLLSSGLTISEVPYTFGCRLNGKSKVTQNLGFIRVFLGQMATTARIRSTLNGRSQTRSVSRPPPTRAGVASEATLVSPSSRKGVPEARR